MKTKIIGICGPSGSGKSTIAEILAKELSAPIIHLDQYFKAELPQICSPDDGQLYPDWNSPESIDYDEILSRICEEKQNRNHEWAIVEGMLLFGIDVLYEMLDIKIFVKANIESCLYRRIIRNIKLFGQSPEFIGGYYLKCARHREAVYCLPYETRADHVIDNDVSFSDQLGEILEYICKKDGI
ncbi:MAG: AAA family ATPase [Clostridia bacterium]|nr:AAA family ATPase [Clostridia bacterium]